MRRVAFLLVSLLGAQIAAADDPKFVYGKKDEVKDVVAGQDCGMAFEGYQDMRQGDVIECYRVEEIKRSL